MHLTAVIMKHAVAINSKASTSGRSLSNRNVLARFGAGGCVWSSALLAAGRATGRGGSSAAAGRATGGGSSAAAGRATGGSPSGRQC
eukprot:11937042-Alexandrium_andersonii.AAC.1